MATITTSIKPGKQRKAWYNLPLHARKARMSAHLSKELRKSLKRRALPLRKGDKVRVVRGGRNGSGGKIARVDRVKGFAFIEGLKRRKADGKEVLVPIRPSNLVIEEIDTADALRLGTKAEKGKEKK